MFFVYAIYNRRHNKFYIGATDDLLERLKEHNNHSFPKSYTARFDGLWDIFHQETVATLEETRIREKQLKSYRGREFLKKLLPQ